MVLSEEYIIFSFQYIRSAEILAFIIFVSNIIISNAIVHKGRISKRMQQYGGSEHY
jgi:hypothetical protein